MNITDSQWIQLIGAIGAGVFVFALSLVLPIRYIIQGLIIIAPFQIVDSKYGSLNVVITYLVTLAILIRGSIRHLPFLGVFLAFTSIMVVASILSPRALLFWNALYLISFGSVLLIYYLVYNYVRDGADVQAVLNALVITNVLVILYCYAQLLLGFDTYSVFGVQEFTLVANRSAEGDHRLAGPFAAVGITAEYLVLQTLILLYDITKRRRRLFQVGCWGLIAANLAFLVATGNRGGVISLVVGLLAFGFAFRNRLGIGRLVAGGVIVAAVFAVGAAIVVSQTEFNLLFDRLEGTQFKGALPETRADVWTVTWEYFEEKPWIGHGPRVVYDPEVLSGIPGQWLNGYPHNLILFVLYSSGIVGLLGGVAVCLALFLALLAGASNGRRVLDSDLARLGVVVFVVFLLDQMKVEFLRFELVDYQQYIAALLGLFTAAAARRSAQNAVIATTKYHKGPVACGYS